MGLVMNNPLPLFLNDLLSEIDCREDIPIYKGGPMSTDTLFYLHTLENITDSLPIANGLYLNGDFTAIKQFITEGNSIKGRIRFFLGYSGWEPGQLKKEIEENRYATTEQKEVEKNIRELILKSIEEQINVYLKSQNRLL